jgi:hypothetical protein
VTTIIDDPTVAFTFAGRRASPEDLAALAERYGLPPTDVGQIMVGVGYGAQAAHAVLMAMCPEDPSIVSEVVDHFYPGAIPANSVAVDSDATVIEFPLSERLQAVGRSLDL